MPLRRTAPLKKTDHQQNMQHTAEHTSSSYDGSPISRSDPASGGVVEMVSADGKSSEPAAASEVEQETCTTLRRTNCLFQNRMQGLIEPMNSSEPLIDGVHRKRKRCNYSDDNTDLEEYSDHKLTKATCHLVVQPEGHKGEGLAVKEGMQFRKNEIILRMRGWRYSPRIASLDEAEHRRNPAHDRFDHIKTIARHLLNAYNRPSGTYSFYRVTALYRTEAGKGFRSYGWITSCDISIASYINVADESETSNCLFEENHLPNPWPVDWRKTLKQQPGYFVEDFMDVTATEDIAGGLQGPFLLVKSYGKNVTTSASKNMPTIDVEWNQGGMV